MHFCQRDYGLVDIIVGKALQFTNSPYVHSLDQFEESTSQQQILQPQKCCEYNNQDEDNSLNKSR